MNIRQTIIVSSLVISSSLVSSPVFAVTSTVTPSVMVQEATAPAKVEYALPYPGILPDHPLYFIKKFRDMLMEKLIADPVRKIEFYVLQADKNINMGVFLVAKEKKSLAIETMILGEKRMAMAAETASTLKQDGKEVSANLVEKLTNALAKHEEVVTGIEGGSEILESIKKLQEDVGKLKE